MAVKAHVMLCPFDATTGAALTGATVNVFSPGTVTPVSGTLFDKNGNTLTNPLTSDASTGLVDFYMNVAQEVDLQVAKSGYTTRTYSNVPVLDDASFDLSALMTTTGDIVYASSANTPARLALGAALQVLTQSGGLPAWADPITKTTASSNLGGDVNLTNTATFFDGPSVSLAPGTWLVIAHATLLDTAAIAAFQVRISDGTTHYASGEANNAGTTSFRVCITVSAIITLGVTTTIKLQAADASATTGVLKAATVGNGSGNNATGIRATRLG